MGLEIQHNRNNGGDAFSVPSKPMFIEKGGCYGDLNITGIDPSAMQDDVALRIETPFHEETILDYVRIRACGLPLRHVSGKLKIETLDIKDFTADGFNSCGTLHIENLIAEYDNPDFDEEDYETYHPDIGQFFDHITQTVSDVRIHNIYIRCKGALIKCFALTEPHRYKNFQIGTGTVDIECEYKYAFLANTLENSYINVGENGTRIKKVKESPYKSKNYEIERYSDNQLIVTDSYEVKPMQADYQIIPNYMNLNDADLREWKSRWPNFNPYELASRDFSVKVYTKALDALQSVRTEWGESLHINSAWRNKNHNRAIGGRSNSDHTWLDHREINASAFDIHIDSIEMGRELERLAIKHGFNAIGRYRKSMFIHVSMREPKPNGRIYQWGRW